MSKFIIISAPSGSGKSTLASSFTYLIFLPYLFQFPQPQEKLDQMKLMVLTYYFISNKEFKENIEKQNFVEWQQVYNNDYKGTLKSEINRLVSKGKTYNI